MKHLFSVFLLWAVLALTVSVSIDPGLVEDIMAEYTSTLSADNLKDVPPPMMREALKKSLPKMQERLVAFSIKMYASGRGAEGVKPNPLLIGFSLGLKQWSDYLSKIIPHLDKVVVKEQGNDSVCLYDEDVCYADKSDSHPCCDITVSCSLSLRYLLML
jgi:hypothetical protein